jgi:hypothetical protein
MSVPVMDQQRVKMRSIATAWGATTHRGPKSLAGGRCFTAVGAVYKCV